MLPEPEINKSFYINLSNSDKQNKLSLFSAKSLLFSGISSLVYLGLSYLLVGFRTDQLVLIGLFNLCYFASHVTRRFILGFSIFIIYWIIFDYMKAFPNFRYNDVHIASLYHAEKALFGIEWNNTLLTPNEYFALHHNTTIDIITGIFYLSWVPVPLAFAGYLFFKNRTSFFQFSLTFFLVNVLGWMGYYLYPAAPPWYVAQYGFDFLPATPGNTAGFARFDAYLNVSIFKGMYAKSSNVFAAMPSMHAAFMMIVFYFGIKHRLQGWNVLFGTIMVGIWFAAVYSGHHYILDVVAGIVCAVLGIALLQWWANSSSGERLIAKLVAETSNSKV